MADIPTINKQSLINSIHNVNSSQETNKDASAIERIDYTMGNMQSRTHASTLAQRPATTSPELLGLPGELRKAIYRMVLVEKDTIQITIQNCRQPPLLCINRQVRKETISIWYTGNRFLHVHRDFDAFATIAFWKHALPAFQKWNISPRCVIELVDPLTSWPNFECWLKTACECNMPLSTFDGSAHLRANVVAGVFDSWKLGGYQSWEEFQDNLLMFRTTTKSMFSWRQAESSAICSSAS